MLAKINFNTKLKALIMLSSIGTLLVLSIAFGIYDVLITKKQTLDKFAALSTVAKSEITENINNPKKLESILAQLNNIRPTIATFILDNNNNIVAKTKDFDATNMEDIKKVKNKISNFYSVETYQVNDGPQKLQLAFLYNSGIFYLEVAKFFYITCLLGLPLLCLAWLVANRLSKHISDPINSLIKSIIRVRDHNDLDVRVKKTQFDEIGVLIDGFNSMMDSAAKLEKNNKKSLQNARESAAHSLKLLEKAEVINKQLIKRTNELVDAEKALNTAKTHLTDIINSMPSMLICVNHKGLVSEINQSALNFLGISDAYGKAIKDLFPDFLSLTESVFATLSARKFKFIEKYKLLKNSQEKFYNILIYPLITEDDNGVVIRIDDVTNEVRMENMMVQTEKMMSVGGLAAGMAHEINNPLGAIMQSSQNIIRRIDKDLVQNQEVAAELNLNLDTMLEYLERRKILKFIDGIIDSGQRAAIIVKNMLQFSRKSNEKLENADVTKILDRSIQLASSDYDLKKNFDFRLITISTNYADKLPQVPCVASEIEQVILNLLRNSAQAMHEHQIKNQRIEIKAYQANNMVAIEVNDNGPGITQEQQKKIFEPFYTTKEVGVGTGLGLSVSYFIIKDKHAGEITVASEQGKGASFKILLPTFHANCREQVA